MRILLESRRRTRIKAEGDSLIILGNGPSLKRNLEENTALLQHSVCMAVNFFANTDAYDIIRPRYYVLADPHFFEKAGHDPNVDKLIENLMQTSWPMTLFIPSRASRYGNRFAGTNVRIARFNFVRADGFKWLENMLWKSGAGMPRPRNVLIPSLMIAIGMGYRTIKVLGADHSWLSTLSVSDDNRVVSVQPHFYKSDIHEEKRIDSVYEGVRLDQVLESMMIAFRSYHAINRFAETQGTRIINATPGSMIDAFQRGGLDD